MASTIGSRRVASCAITLMSEKLMLSMSAPRRLSSSGYGRNDQSVAIRFMTGPRFRNDGSSLPAAGVSSGAAINALELAGERVGGSKKLEI